MKIRAFAAFVALSLGLAACNDVPVRNLTSSYQVQVQELRDRGKPAKLDILWVVDSSPSMCQEQQSLASSFRAFLEVFQKYTAIDMQLAVTTSNVCAKGSSGAVRGRFVYQPASDLPPACLERRVLPCLNDAQCQNYVPKSGESPLPDAAAWVCEPPKKGAEGLWFCDTPPEVKAEGGDDKYPGDYLFTVGSACRYKCDREENPGRCAQVFGQPEGCKRDSAAPVPSMCEAGTCATSACESNPELATSSVDCSARCRGRECAEVCGEFLADAAACKAKCDAVGSCVDVCQAVSKVEDCGDVCQSDWTCQQKCEDTLRDSGKCQAVCEKATAAECQTECTTRFTNQEFLCFLACDTKYECSDRCIAQFGEPSYRCLYPGGNDKTKAGCLLPPATGPCPAPNQGPKILNSAAADQWLKEWIAGRWAGSPDFDPKWKDLPVTDSTEDFAAREGARSKVFEQLFKCMATVGADQLICNNQEQHLRAAFMALDPEGENADQAKRFLRDDAYLLIVIIGDEDDCSAPEYERTAGKFENRVTAEDYGRCTCLRDEDGCLNTGECDPSKCLTNGKFDASKCPLYSTARFVNQLRSLKADPAQVVFATITGSAIPGSVTTPSADVPLIEKRFFDCKCDEREPFTAPVTYACLGDNGQADLGIRMARVAQAFGAQYGQLANICQGDIAPILESIALKIIPFLTQVCLPRPMEWSCQGKCESLFNDREKCQQTCGASDCFATCQDAFLGKPGCAGICSSGEFVEVFKYDAKGKCAKDSLDEDGNCLPLEFAANSDAPGDYFLVQNSPTCPLFDVTLGERLENAIQFKIPLEFSDRIEVVYRVGAFSCQDRCGRIFKDQPSFCDGLCNGTIETCIDTCTKAPAARRCGYVCGTKADTCAQRCSASGSSNCSAVCKD